MKFAVAALVVSASLAGCNKGPSTEALLADAKQYLQKGDQKASLIQLKNAVASNPTNAEARQLLGGVHNSLRDPVSAEKELRKALELGAPRSAVAGPLAEALLGQGKFQAVIDETANDSGAAVLFHRGIAYIELKQLQQAKALFEQILQQSPNDVNGLMGMARYALLSNDSAGAERYVGSALAANPKSLDALYFRADLQRAQNQPDKAIATYDEVLKIDPTYNGARLLKAHVETSQGKFDAAQADITAARKQAPAALSVHFAQARLYYVQQKYTQAMESLLQILRASPNDTPALLLAGATQYALGSLPQAEQYLKTYLELDAGNLYARKLLAATRIRAGNGAEALGTLAPPLKEGIQDAELYSLAAEAALKVKDYSKATAYFEKAASLAPDSAKLHAGLGVSTLGQGNSNRAVTELERAIKLDTDSEQAGSLLVMTSLRLNQLDKAMTTAKSLAAAKPDSPLPLYLMAQVYQEKKDNTNARAMFEKALAMQPAYFEPVAALAKMDLLEGKPAAAKQRYEAFLKKNSKHAGTMIALASLALVQGQKEEGQRWLERAYTENPGALEPALLYIGHVVQYGDKQKGLTLARNLLTSHASNADVLDLLGKAQSANDEKGAALETYSKLVSLRPSSAQAHFRLAQMYIATENNTQAASTLRTALGLQPENVEIQAALISVEMKRGNVDGVLQGARKLQKQLPKSGLGYTLEGDLMMLTSKPDAAAKAYAEAFARNQDTPALVKLADSLRHTGHAKDADARLAQWQAKYPNDAFLHAYLGTEDMKAQRWTAAIQHYQAALKQQPNNAAILNNLAWCLFQTKDKSALQVAEQAYKLTGDEPSVLDTLGWVTFSQGDTARSLMLLQKANKLAPNAPDVGYHYASALAKSGNKQEARKLLERTLAESKEFASRQEAQDLLKQL